MKRPKRHPEEYTDTDPRAMEVWLEILRRKTPGERLASALQLSELAIRMSESGARARFPAASEREILVRVAERHLPQDLVRAAYGWTSNDGEPR